ncbi:ATP-dependent acyl-CoA ligase [Pseudooceanicola nitratireducens]|uniref:AMP-binding protein n=1 Tax=Pseudooceanicola nitratireducens TaxID=517719 RepID=UPI0031039083
MTDTHESVFAFFTDTARAYPASPFLAIPERMVSDWGIQTELTYGEAAERIDALARAYAGAGYRRGDLVALAYDSRPQHVLHYLALNSLGICSVPINTDLTPAEISYVLQNSRAAGIVALPEFAEPMRKAINMVDHPVSLAIEDPALLDPPGPRHRRFAISEDPRLQPAAVLYTSGTTGNPKGCVLSNLYAQLSGLGYGNRDGALEVRRGEERILNPLPLYHMNSLMLTLGGVIAKGACLVLPGRFSLSNWWSDVTSTGTTRIHYLGIMIPALLSRPASPADRQHAVRVGLGAGVDPGAHQAFEDRFGIPLHEVWGMTETGRGLSVSEEPREIDTRACGKPPAGFDARIEREDGTEAAIGEPGELVVRNAGDDPRAGFFLGYLDNPEATEEAWAGGWFHTGDICTRSAEGMFYFVDRKKNIVRRSGENISSAEVEAVLSTSPLVAQVAVVGVPDQMRDEEVMACVVPAEGVPRTDETARALLEHANAVLAYYKAPGWVRFLDALPTTGTQKTQKHRLFPDGFRPDMPGVVDLRALKKRKVAAA